MTVGDGYCYYLGSRFYSPELGRFLNADVHTDTMQGVVGANMFIYCNNNPVNFFDPKGMAAQTIKQVLGYHYGVNYDIGNGWKARIDRGNDGVPGHERHVHVWKGKDSYSQNDDGSPHDGSTGNPPKSVQKKLKEKLGWEWKKMTATPSLAFDTNVLYNYAGASVLGMLIGVIIFLLTGNPAALSPAYA